MLPAVRQQAAAGALWGDPEPRVEDASPAQRTPAAERPTEGGAA
jgi:hypothetical protein